MGSIEFVFIDGIAVGLLIADEGERRFCAATQTLHEIEGRAFFDVSEAQDFIVQRLRRRHACDDADRARADRWKNGMSGEDNANE